MIGKRHLGNDLQFLPHWNGIRMGRYKLRLRSIESGGLEALHLYDLNVDAGEKFDISSRHPELVDRLLAQAKNFLVELKAGSRPLGTI